MKDFENIFVITRHTPTQTIGDNPKPGFIYRKNNHIAIDVVQIYERNKGGRMCKRFYLLVRGNVECNHEDDEWLGIYDDVEKLYTAYKRAVQGLEEERKTYEEKYGKPMNAWTLRNEKILLSSFDEYNGEWKHWIEPEEIFADMIQIELERDFLIIR